MRAKKQSKVAIFREEVPTSGKIIGGNLIFFLQIFGAWEVLFVFILFTIKFVHEVTMSFTGCLIPN
jgi:hypothetical protein